MMSVPGFQKRGGGMMVLCRFHYKKEDVDCAYCQSYMRHTCQASVCPYIPERLEAGTVSYQELAEGCLHMAGHQKLWNRLSSLPKGKSLPLVLEPAHRRRLSEWLEAGIATSCPHELAAAYLLSSRAGLWRRVLPHISHGRIDFSSISLRGIDPRDYPVYRAAKGLYCGTLLITSSELADEEQVSSEAFGDILNAMLIARYSGGLLRLRGLWAAPHPTGKWPLQWLWLCVLSRNNGAGGSDGRRPSRSISSGTGPSDGWAGMKQQKKNWPAESNMTALKTLSHTLLHLDIQPTKMSPLVVKHPFTDSGLAGIYAEDGSLSVGNLLDSPDALRTWRENFSRRINEAETAMNLFCMITKPYQFGYLRLAAAHLSEQDMKEKHLWMKAMVWSNGRLTPWLLLSSCPCRK